MHAQAGGQGAARASSFGTASLRRSPCGRRRLSGSRATSLFGRRAAAEIARLSPDSRLLLCCALPHKVVFGETNQPNGERYRGHH